MPLSDEEIQATKLWVRRKGIPSLLVHFTPDKHLPDIAKSGYLKPRVSAVAVHDLRPITVLKKIMPSPWDLHVAIPIPPHESYKFKRVLYPYKAFSVMDEMLTSEELELVDQSVFPEYGPELWQYTNKSLYVEELESVSIVPVKILPFSV